MPFTLIPEAGASPPLCNRRSVLQLMAGIAVCGASVVQATTVWPMLPAPMAGMDVSTLVFDPRSDLARDLAQNLPTLHHMSVEDDPTALWHSRQGLAEQLRRGGVLGVTTQAPWLCLTQLARDHGARLVLDARLGLHKGQILVQEVHQAPQHLAQPLAHTSAQLTQVLLALAHPSVRLQPQSQNTATPAQPDNTAWWQVWLLQPHSASSQEAV